MHSTSFEIEWPPKSGAMQSFPEVDRYAWFTLEKAKTKINAGQKTLLNELQGILASKPSTHLD